MTDTSFTPTPPARRKLTWGMAILLVAGFAIALALWGAAVAALRLLQAARCPAATFFDTSPEVATLLMIVPLFFPAIPLGLAAANAMAYAIPPLRRALEQEANEAGSEPYSKSQSILLKMAGVIAAVVLPVACVASLNQVCLTPNAIVANSEPWRPLVAHAWNEVIRIRTGCTRTGKSSWAGWYDLVLRDGREIELMDGVGDPSHARTRIAAALRHVAFTVDASHVSPRCGDPRVAMLRSPP
jgi:hypothetical protein